MTITIIMSIFWRCVVHFPSAYPAYDPRAMSQVTELRLLFLACAFCRGKVTVNSSDASFSFCRSFPFVITPRTSDDNYHHGLFRFYICVASSFDRCVSVMSQSKQSLIFSLMVIFGRFALIFLLVIILFIFFSYYHSSFLPSVSLARGHNIFRFQEIFTVVCLIWSICSFHE